MPSCAGGADIHLCEGLTLCTGCIVLHIGISPFVLLLVRTSVILRNCAQEPIFALRYLVRAAMNQK